MLFFSQYLKSGILFQNILSIKGILGYNPESYNAIQDSLILPEFFFLASSKNCFSIFSYIFPLIFSLIQFYSD